MVTTALAVILAVGWSAADRRVFRDEFTGSPVPERRALRGEWRIGDGVAQCQQNDELFRQNKDHGPILFYDVPFQDATVRFAFQAKGCQTVVLTANGKQAHVFRLTMGEKATSVRAFPTGERPIGLAELPPLKQGEWVDVIVTWHGPQATIQIGSDIQKTVEYPGYAQEKTNISIGFSYGSLSVKGLILEIEKGSK
jgi:hypothetical protein